MKRALWTVITIALLTSANQEVLAADGLDFGGSFRLRTERIFDTGNTQQRIQAKFGVKKKFSNTVDVKLKLATGSTLLASSRNQNLDGSFVPKTISVDQARVKWTPHQFTLLGGKFKNPYHRPGKTQLIWDHDVTPEGMNINFSNNFGKLDYFVNTGFLWLVEASPAPDTYAYVGQLGFKYDTSGYWFGFGGSYYGFDAMMGRTVLGGVSTSAFGNATNSVTTAGVTTSLTYATGFQLAEGYLELGWDWGSQPFSLFGDYVRNIAADTGHTGWATGFKYGKVKKKDDYAFKYEFRHIKQNAVVGFLTDSEMGGTGTNKLGHKFTIKHACTDFLHTGVSHFWATRKLGDSPEFHRTQLDFSYKF